ncbi:MAG: hypothetical protein ACYDBS_02955, partial [Acidimicrobiales bacterium]
MTETETRIGRMLKEASDYASARAGNLTASDIVEGRVTLLSGRTEPRRGRERPRPRLRTALPMALVGLSVVLVVGLAVGLGGGRSRPSGPRTPSGSGHAIGPAGKQPDVLLATLNGALELVSPASGAVIGHVRVEWSGAPFQPPDPLVAVASGKLFIGGWEGHGGDIILASSLSGRAPAKLVASIGSLGALAALAVSPSGRRLAWILTGGAAGSGQLVTEDLASGRRTSVMLDKLLPASLTGSIPVISWAPSGHSLLLAVGWSSYPGRISSQLIVYNVLAGHHRSVHLSPAAVKAIGPDPSAVAWGATGGHVFVASQRCLPDEKCLSPSTGAPLAEIDLSTGQLLRTFSRLQSVSSLSLDSATGNLAVVGQEEGPHLRPLFVNY